MSFPKAILITTLGKRPTAIQMAAVSADVSDDGSSYYSDGGGAKKRRRLTHLSADEKIMRRKLKNRVAAQTARDRKKAQMQDLEEMVAQLEDEKKQLMKENAQLRLSQTAIQKENALLRSQVVASSSSSSSATTKVPAPAPAPAPAPTPTLLVACKKEVPDCPALPCKTEPEFPGSAAPAVSLPKEQIQALSRVMMHYAACALTLSLMLCFISWKNSGAKVESSSSRKRKQAKPARRPSVSSETTSAVSLGEKSPLRPAWWGPHQQTWAPSMN